MEHLWSLLIVKDGLAAAAKYSCKDILKGSPSGLSGWTVGRYVAEFEISRSELLEA